MFNRVTYPVEIVHLKFNLLTLFAITFSHPYTKAFQKSLNP